jgi:hypothetical protein
VRMRSTDVAITAYFLLLITKAINPSLRVRVRSYDMFAHALPARRTRTALVFHHRNGEVRVLPSAHSLPFEPARCTSILRAAADMGPDAVREIGIASLRAQRRGWRALDQVWGPPRPIVRDACAVCIHVVEASELGRLHQTDHSRCRVPLSHNLESQSPWS